MNFALLTDRELSHYHHCTAMVLCNPPRESCLLRKCPYCPPLNTLSVYLTNAFENNGYDEDDTITFKQWIKVDNRYCLEDINKTVSSFVEYFVEAIDKLIPHSFISSQQADFIKCKKKNLALGEFLVLGDFAENCSFVIQNAIQGYHWNNDQATAHPFVVYYKTEDNLLQHWNFIIISDCMHHDAVAVQLFISKMNKRMESKFKLIKKITYITDGAGSQYKNKNNFINLYMHRFDFGYEADWHFHAASHGKGRCDGLGGSLKRKATRASLTRQFADQITSPKLLYTWAMESDINADVEYRQKLQ